MSCTQFQENSLISGHVFTKLYQVLDMTKDNDTHPFHDGDIMAIRRTGDDIDRQKIG